MAFCCFNLLFQFVVSICCFNLLFQKKGFFGVLEPFSIIKKVLKFVLIGIAIKWEFSCLVGSFWIWL
ncbi:hypothetical protein BZK23_06310 [Helicobacter pylori]|nr:hypothetical protein BZK23_06310 [Helicobacter pylori]